MAAAVRGLSETAVLPAACGTIVLTIIDLCVLVVFIIACEVIIQMAKNRCARPALKKMEVLTGSR